MKAPHNDERQAYNSQNGNAGELENDLRAVDCGMTREAPLQDGPPFRLENRHPDRKRGRQRRGAHIALQASVPASSPAASGFRSAGRRQPRHAPTSTAAIIPTHGLKPPSRMSSIGHGAADPAERNGKRAETYGKHSVALIRLRAISGSPRGTAGARAGRLWRGVAHPSLQSREARTPFAPRESSATKCNPASRRYPRRRALPFQRITVSKTRKYWFGRNACSRESL